jgi:uncharacterized protein
MPEHRAGPERAIFDPFRDRLSRLIRNDLSRVLPQVLATADLAPARAVAEGYLGKNPPPGHAAYIRERLALYARALEEIRSRPCAKPFAQALVLWDLGLFLEVHEVLEHAWHRAGGREKALLQAMIRAAGFYIKNEYGFREGAAKMAGKAAAALEENRQALPADFPLARLLAKLRSLDPEPPRLLR